MWWEESESTARGWSWTLGAIAAIAGVVLTIAALRTGYWILLGSYFVALAVFAGFVLVWVLFVGGSFAAFLGLAKSIAWSVSRTCRKHED